MLSPPRISPKTTTAVRPQDYGHQRNFVVASCPAGGICGSLSRPIDVGRVVAPPSERTIMEFTLTEHARKRCARRGIDTKWIAAALQHSTDTFPDLVDPDATHVRFEVPERGFRTLRVVINDTVDPVQVITAFFESATN